ncbi:MAG: helix-hairpin-helix domain-containing protein [Legionella longbeachae]|nr:helix-hairpin-helix domain-containing protein [Legionella longbeachae]
MKAKAIAVLLSLFVVTVSSHASIQKKVSDKKDPPIVVHKIDINKADLSELTGSVKGIGKKRAEAIIAYRKSHNGFKSLEELTEVKGLGKHFMDINRDKLNTVFVVNKTQ